MLKIGDRSFVDINSIDGEKKALYGDCLFHGLSDHQIACVCVYTHTHKELFA